MGIDIGDLTGQVVLDDKFSQALDAVVDGAMHALDSLDGLMGVLGAGAIVATTAIVGMSAAIIALGERGSDVNDVSGTLEHFAGSAGAAAGVLDALKEGTKGTVDEFVLMKDAAHLLSAGVDLTAEQFGTLGAAAFELQNRGLGGTKEMMDLVSSAMVTGRTRALSLALGVVDVKDAQADFAKSLGVTKDELSQSGIVEANRIAIMKMLDAATVNSAMVTRDFGENIEFAKTKIVDWVDKLSSAVAASPSVNNAMLSIGMALEKAFGGDADTMMATITGWINQFANTVSEYAPGIIQGFADILHNIVGVVEYVKSAWDAIPDWVKYIGVTSLEALIGINLFIDAVKLIGSSEIFAGIVKLVGAIKDLAIASSAEGIVGFGKVLTGWASPVTGAWQAIVKLGTGFVATAGFAGTLAFSLGAITVIVASTTKTIEALYQAYKLASEALDRWHGDNSQAIIDQANMQRAAQLAGHEFGTLAEAVKFMQQRSSDMRLVNKGLVDDFGTDLPAASTKTGNSFIDLSKKSDEFNKKVTAITEGLLGESDGLKATQVALARLTPAQQANYDIQLRTLPLLQSLVQAHLALTPAQLDSYRATLSARDALVSQQMVMLQQKQVDLDYIDRQKSIGRSDIEIATNLGVTELAFKSYGEELKRNKSYLEQAETAMQNNEDTTVSAAEAIGKSLTLGGVNVLKDMAIAGGTLQLGMSTNFVGITGTIQDFSIQAKKHFESVSDTTLTFQERIKDVHQGLGDLASVASQLGSMFSGTFGTVFDVIGVGIKEVQTLTTQVAQLSKTSSDAASHLSSNASANIASAGVTASIILGILATVYEIGKAIDAADKKASDLATQLKLAVDSAKDFGKARAFTDSLLQSIQEIETTLRESRISTMFSDMFPTAVRSNSAAMTDQLIRQVAEAMKLPEIIKELGGWSQLTADQLKTVGDSLDKLFVVSVKASGQVATDAMKALDDTLSQMATETATVGGVFSKTFTDAIKKAQELGVTMKATQDIINAQTTSAEDGLLSALGRTNTAYTTRHDLLDQIGKAEDTLKGQTGAAAEETMKTIMDLNAQYEVQQGIIDATAVTTQTAADGIAGALVGVVSSQMAAGKSFLESITGAAPAIQELATEMSQAGLSGGAAFDLLSKEADLATDKIAGPALQSIHDYTQGLVGITNAGQGTQDIFEGIVSQVTKTRDALIAQGKDGTSVMIAMQGDLQNVWDLQNKYNFKLDETSQKMVDDAEKAGLVGEAHKSAADQSVDALNRIADKLDVLIGKMGSGLPAATGAFTRSVADAATRNADATRRMVDDWGNVEDAVDHTTYGRSPTGVYGYIDSTSAAATETATQTGRMADAWGTVEDSANNVIGATNSISGAMATTTGKVTKNIDGLSDGFKALLAQMSSVSSSTVQLGTEAVSPDGQPTNPFEGYATGPQLISEADAITRIQQVAIHYTGHAANDAELAAMGAAYGYNGKGQISSLHLESFLKELVQHYLEGTYTGFAQGGEVTQQGPMISGHGTDTTMAFLTPGETVTTKSQSTSQHDTMAAMHAEMVGMRMDFSRYMARQADDIGRAVRDHAQLSQ